MENITSFTGENKFYSNFYPVIVNVEGLNFPTVEHAYQACKTKEFFFRKLMAQLPADKAGLARKRGQTIIRRTDWPIVKIDTMHDLLCQKFNQEPFKTKLMKTIDAHIEEGNFWHDNEWGNCKCEKCKSIEGQNWMGRLLDDIRSQLIAKGNCYRRYTQ